jgi:hypothetical protein
MSWSMHASPPRWLSPAYVHRQAIDASSLALSRGFPRANKTDAKHVLLLKRATRRGRSEDELADVRILEHPAHREAPRDETQHRHGERGAEGAFDSLRAVPGRVESVSNSNNNTTNNNNNYNICMCVCERERECVCVCVCVRERERERETVYNLPSHANDRQRRLSMRHPRTQDLASRMAPNRI